ncbi:hypothetical protein QR680_017193 [Steinernema hermaphroditum]|uniref:EGF-like domain-containing protein n=1 Tax=Steinernema hermaphroditum TaxID=289476 RepID=A0AA39HG22_9BILA|nr:hypothetical protein QR680_017193 [Steinernema hermaphroditum]
MDGRLGIFFIVLVLGVNSAEDFSTAHSPDQRFNFPDGGHVHVPCALPPNFEQFGVVRSSEDHVIVLSMEAPKIKLPCKNGTVIVEKSSCNAAFCSSHGKCKITNATLPHQRFNCHCDHGHWGRFCEVPYAGKWYIMYILWIVVIFETSAIMFAVFRHSRQSQFRSFVDHLRFVDILNGAEY